MRGFIRFGTMVSLLAIVFLTCSKNNPESPPTQTLEQKLAALPGATLTEIDVPAGFEKAFEITLPQPVDHDNPSGQQFSQRVLISHIDESAPTVFLTWGYMVNSNRVHPLTEFLGANQVFVDHRYFGDATPDPVDWQHLNRAQTAADWHRVAELLKPIYTGPWVSHGISKGGGAVLFYRSYYPDDVAATVAQVASVSTDTADTRFDDFLLNQVGTADCRERIQSLQRAVLLRRDSLLPLYEDYVNQNGIEFRMGLEATFEFNTLELMVTFWQYGPHDCTVIPDSTASTQEIFAYVQDLCNIEWLEDSYMTSMEPAIYQMYTELGWYRFIDDHVADLLQTPFLVSYSNFYPPGVERFYDPTSALELIQWLQTEGDNILYIYGEYDPFTACKVELTGQVNALSVILPGENHYAGFHGYGPYTEEIRDSLESWLGITINSAASAPPVPHRERGQTGGFRFVTDH